MPIVESFNSVLALAIIFMYELLQLTHNISVSMDHFPRTHLAVVGNITVLDDNTPPLNKSLVWWYLRPSRGPSLIDVAHNKLKLLLRVQSWIHQLHSNHWGG